MAAARGKTGRTIFNEPRLRRWLAEELAKVFSHAGRESFHRLVAKFCKCGVGGGDVCGMIEAGRGRKGEWRVLGRSQHGGGVGFHEEAVGWDEWEHFPEPAVTGSEIGGVEGEIGAEFGEGRDQFSGTAVGVEEESAGGK